MLEPCWHGASGLGGSHESSLKISGFCKYVNIKKRAKTAKKPRKNAKNRFRKPQKPVGASPINPHRNSAHFDGLCQKSKNCLIT